MDVINEDTLIVPADRLSIADLGGEAVVLDLDTGIYFGLNEVGTRIFDLLSQPQTVQKILKVLLSEYEIDRVQLKKDLLSFLQKLAEHKLVQLQN